MVGTLVLSRVREAAVNSGYLCHKELQKAWDECNHMERVDAWDRLYYRRFHRLAPAKHDPCNESMSDDNVDLCNAWHRSWLAELDAILEVVRLEKRVAELERWLEDMER
jgi:hypothetical protein